MSYELDVAARALPGRRWMPLRRGLRGLSALAARADVRQAGHRRRPPEELHDRRSGVGPRGAANARASDARAATPPSPPKKSASAIVPKPDPVCALYAEGLTLVTRKLPPLILALTAALFVAACGGASDEVNGGEEPTASSGPKTTLSLVGYAVPKPGFDRVIPAFQHTEQGANVAFKQSYGASGDQSRKVEAGLDTDVVNFSVEPDVTRLVDAGKVDAELERRRRQGHRLRIRGHHRHPRRQPEEHPRLGRPAPARPRGRHAEPVQLGLGQVEPAALRTRPRATAARTSRPASTTSAS